MRAMVIDAFGPPDVLRRGALPTPAPGPGEVLVRMVAAGVQPIDAEIRAGLHQQARPHGFPLVLGWDAAGIVEALGRGAGRFSKGDKVWGFAQKPTIQHGCYAEYASIPEDQLVPMPRKLLFEEAAALPGAGLTALQALAEVPGIGRRHTVLVDRAADGVGHLTLQLARNAGARTLAVVADAEEEALARDLGASSVLRREDADPIAATRELCPEGVDWILDGSGGAFLQAAVGVLKEGGCLISRVSSPDSAALAARSARGRKLEPRPNENDLLQLAETADQNRLRPRIERIYRLDQAREAHERIEAGPVRGALVLNL